MKKYSFYLPIIFYTLTIIICCFLPWARIPSSMLQINGFDTTPTTLGKPGLLTIIFVIFTAIMTLSFRGKWGKKIGLIFVAFLLAWQIRNWLLLSICHFGECLEILIAFHINTLLTLLLFIHIFSSSLKNKQ